MSGGMLAAFVAEFYRGLIDGGVPPEIAAELTLALGRQVTANVALSPHSR